MPTNHPVPNNILDVMAAKIKRLEMDMQDLRNNKTLTGPMYDKDNLPAQGVTGQVGVIDDSGSGKTFTIYDGTAWQTLASGGSGPRMVWGSVYNDGDVDSGTGFTSQNDYGDGINFTRITFDTEFENTPITLLTPNNNNSPDPNPGPNNKDGRYIVSLIEDSSDETQIVVRIESIDDADYIDNGGFQFLCIEPGI